jgi:hypothetical protein
MDAPGEVELVSDNMVAEETTTVRDASPKATTVPDQVMEEPIKEETIMAAKPTGPQEEAVPKVETSTVAEPSSEVHVVEKPATTAVSEMNEDVETKQVLVQTSEPEQPKPSKASELAVPFRKSPTSPPQPMNMNMTSRLLKPGYSRK